MERGSFGRFVGNVGGTVAVVLGGVAFLATHSLAAAALAAVVGWVGTFIVFMLLILFLGE